MMDETKTEGQKLQELLSFKHKNVWEKATEKDIKRGFAFSEENKRFLNSSKTEREFTANAEKLAAASGFIALEDLFKKNKKIEPGSKVYFINRKKSAVFAVVGKRPLEEGTNIIGAHIDAPRIDLKQNPIYEDTDLVFFKTH
jgi:aspartyl aminopeptidase